MNAVINELLFNIKFLSKSKCVPTTKSCMFVYLTLGLNILVYGNVIETYM